MTVAPEGKWVKVFGPFCLGFALALDLFLWPNLLGHNVYPLSHYRWSNARVF